MNKKILFAILLITVLMIWIFWIRHLIGDAIGNISEWGGYLLIGPLFYSLFMALGAHVKFSYKKSAFVIFIGSIIPLILSKNFADSYWFLKLIMLIAGFGLVYIWRIIKTIENKNIK